ncbi:MAG: membrane protein insertion efficiency factor YidD [Armatimonadota bacterium]|nr:membrane protein insertion efficiency factor YidD [Armatimonadota bacterium]
MGAEAGGAAASVAKAVVALIRVYQKTISAWTPRTCRYYPTCSEYAAQAVTRYGAVRGLWMAARRIVRCHPFAPGGHDPVP